MADADHAASADSVADFKQQIQRNTDQLAHEFRSGQEINRLLQARSRFIDQILIGLWKRLLCTDTEYFALIAVGGYGRRELQPHSDIDILILYDLEITPDHEQALEKYLQFLWDIGLKPGHSLRTLSQCRASAAEDQVILTTLIESRLLYGSETLFRQMQEETDSASVWPIQQYFQAKLEEQQTRYAKFNDTGFNLEPNIKEGPGGLRDIHVISWLKKRHYHLYSLRQLVDEGCLTVSEFRELAAARDFLNQVRFALHILAGRAENRLLFDHQRVLAEQFGFTQTEKSTAVEQFMQKYYRTVMAVERLSEMLLQLFRETTYTNPENCGIESINRNFQSVCDYIEVSNPDTFSRTPQALLEIFLLLEQIPRLKGIRATTIRLIRENLHLVDEEFRRNPANKKCFTEILSQRTGVFHSLRRMNRYGLLAAYIPDFARITGQLQHDLFHVYTVDEHTLFLIRNLRRFALDKHRDELPFCNDIFLLIRKPSLLYLAGLFHDIAKGRGGDHSVLGETIARQFCLSHRFTEQDSDLVSWLVRNHLVMSMTAQKKDITDPEVIFEFATAVGSLERLNYLYLLTVADIRATNPEIWNSWKDSLLKDLYMATQRALHRGLENPSDRGQRATSSRNEARSILYRMGLAPTTVDSVWKNLNDEYFLRYSVGEAVWHTIAIASTGSEELPLVLLRPQSERSSLEILLYTVDEDHLFSDSTAILDHLGLTILDARIITTRDGMVVNSYLVMEQNGHEIRELQREQQICNTLRRRLVNRDTGTTPKMWLGNRQMRYRPLKPRIMFDHDPQQNYTLMELTAADKPGLLSIIGEAFNQLDIRVHQAKITTIGNRAEDVFYITDLENRPLQSEQSLHRIRKHVLELISHTSQDQNHPRS